MDHETKRLVSIPDDFQKQHSSGDASWKVVDAQCAQLQDSVRGAQVPMLLALLWGFAWMVTLYNHDYGYTKKRLADYEKVLSIIENTNPTNVYATFIDHHEISRYHLSANDSTNKLSNATITNILQEQMTALLRQQVELWQFTFPGTPLKVTIFDLGVIGCGGMILVYSWFFYAARRENHAIKSFLDIRDNAARYKWFPQRFVLEPKLSYLSPQHYAYAYHAVAHRFLFLFSTRSGPLLGSTVLLMVFPFLVAVWSYFTDLRDFRGIYYPLGEWASRGFRVGISGMLLASLGVITLRIIGLAINTSVLLNAWYLATRDCWSKSLNQPMKECVGPIYIDREQQEALEESRCQPTGHGERQTETTEGPVGK